MHALIDADILLYRVGYTTEEESEDIAKYRMDELIHRILDDVEAREYNLYLSAGRLDTFRAKLNPEYKANRTQPKPLHYDFLKKHLIENWHAIVAVDEEADDLLGIMQTLNTYACIQQALEGASYNETIICSIDKDLLQIPGLHYNFVKNEFITITEDEGLLWFYKQLLIGDTSDNIKGVEGIGKAKASKLLDSYLGEDEQIIFDVVQETYRNWLQKEWDEWDDFKEHQMDNIIRLNGQLLKIRTKEGEIWKLPTDN